MSFWRPKRTKNAEQFYPSTDPAPSPPKLPASQPAYIHVIVPVYRHGSLQNRPIIEPIGRYLESFEPFTIPKLLSFCIFVKQKGRMPSIPINSKIQLELQSVMEGIASLDTPELEIFAAKVNNMLARRKAPALTERETQLLLSINQGLPADLQKRFKKLIKKAEQELLSEKEQQEYMDLASKAEEIDVLRLESLVELAQIRSTSVDELLRQLQINLVVNG